MFPLDSIMYEGMGFPFNQTHEPFYVSWYCWCWLFRLMLVAIKLVLEESLVYSLFIDLLWFRYGLHSELFWLYALLLAVYMRNFAYLCIMVWILMDAHGFVDICIKIYKIIYYIKNAPKNAPTPEAFENFTFCFAPASRFRFHSQVTLACAHQWC